MILWNSSWDTHFVLKTKPIYEVCHLINIAATEYTAIYVFVYSWNTSATAAAPQSRNQNAKFNISRQACWGFVIVWLWIGGKQASPAIVYMCQTTATLDASCIYGSSLLNARAFYQLHLFWRNWSYTWSFIPHLLSFVEYIFYCVQYNIYIVIK